jgi:DNA-binding NarL/FixJ family response regulator
MRPDCGTLLIVDDDAGFRALMRAVLEAAGYAVLEAEGRQDASERAADMPRLALVDVNLSGTTGFAVLRDLRERLGNAFPVIFVSGERVEPFDVAGGFVVGADDYVVKPVDAGELVERVGRLLTRSTADAIVTAYAQPKFDLTAREYGVLELLVDGCDQDEIAQRLVISPNTVATHIQRILAKLRVHSRAQAVALAVREQVVQRRVRA